MISQEFEGTARDIFGLDRAEAATLAGDMDAAGFSFEEWDADDPLFWEVASDVADEFFEDVEMYDLDPYFPGDDYLDPGVEMELTAESEEGYGDD